MKRLLQRPRPRFRRPTTDAEKREYDQMYTRVMVAELVANRIMQGIPPEVVLRRIGHSYKERNRRYRKLSEQEWAVIKLHEIEQGFLSPLDADEHDWHAPGRLSTLQRYARAIGAKLQIGLYPELRLPKYHEFLRSQRTRARRRRRAGLRVPVGV